MMATTHLPPAHTTMPNAALLLFLPLAAAAAAVLGGAGQPALGGLDVIECAQPNATGTGVAPCAAVGSAEYATTYTSVDVDGTPRFSAEFRFVSRPAAGLQTVLPRVHAAR